MKYQVKPQQYARLVECRDNWSERMSQTYHDAFDLKTGCLVTYLATNAGLDTNELDKINIFRVMSTRSRLGKDIFEFYGIPETQLDRWEESNSFVHLFGQRRRAKGMLRRVQRFIDEVEVVPEPLEIVPIEQQEVYVTR